MPSNTCTAIDIGNGYTKVVVGNNKKIKLCGLLKMPEGSVVNNNIMDVGAVAQTLKAFMNENKINSSDAYFAIQGQDLVVRHLEIPMMNVKSIRQAVEYEINQYLPEDGANHYVDYEIIEKINTPEKKAYKLVVVAAPKAKVNKYIELARAMNMKVKAIDISSNCATRVFKEKEKYDPSVKKSTGIIDIGYNTSNITILENGKLFIEREINFGIYNIVKEISSFFNDDYNQAYQYLFEKFSFNNADDGSGIHKKILSMFDEGLDSFEKIIQFYTTGRIEKTLDKIYIIGGGSGVKGIDFYYGSYFNTSAYVADSPEKLPCKLKFPVGCDLNVYINALGLVLRKE